MALSHDQNAPYRKPGLKLAYKVNRNAAGRANRRYPVKLKCALKPSMCYALGCKVHNTYP